MKEREETCTTAGGKLEINSVNGTLIGGQLIQGCCAFFFFFLLIECNVTKTIMLDKPKHVSFAYILCEGKGS